jgi:pilus assembly protein CpaC
MRALRPYLLSILALLASAAAAPAGPAPELGQQAPRTRSLHLGLNKSTVITLDADVREVIIPAPSIASAVVRTARSVYLTGERPGQTNAFFVGKDGEQLLRLDISVEPDHSQMLSLIRRHIAGSRVRAEAIGDQIVLSGTVRNPIDAVQAASIAARFTGSKDKVLNLIEVTSQEQVLLKVTIAEADRTAIQRLGLDLRNLASEAQRLGIAGLTQSAFPITSGTAASAAYNVTARTITAPESGGVLTAVWQAGGANVHAVIEAMNATARSDARRAVADLDFRRNRQFVAGGEFRFLSRGTQFRRVSWKQFGGAGVHAYVLSEGRISLKSPLKSAA